MPLSEFNQTRQKINTFENPGQLKVWYQENKNEINGASKAYAKYKINKMLPKSEREKVKPAKGKTIMDLFNSVDLLDY